MATNPNVGFEQRDVRANRVIKTYWFFLKAISLILKLKFLILLDTISLILISVLYYLRIILNIYLSSILAKKQLKCFFY